MDRSDVTLPPNESITPTLVLQTERYTEGVVYDDQGNLYFSQTKAGTISVLTPEGSCQIWATVEGANGHKILPDKTHVVAAKNAVVQLDANGQILNTIRHFNGEQLVYPNDITVDPEGGFYFTDSGVPDLQNPTGCVYYVDAEGQLSQVTTGIAFANGLVLTPDRQHLFVAESLQNRILAYKLTSAGAVGASRVFADLPLKQGDQIDNQPDGLCLDALGNLYVAHYGMRQVVVLAPTGQIIRQYTSGNLTTSNCTFGGANGDQLFVSGGIETEAGAGGIFRLDLGVPGASVGR